MAGMAGKRVLAVASAAALIGGVVVYALFKRDIDNAASGVAAGSEIAETAAGPIEYAVRGEGVALLSIHGSGGGYDQGLAVAESLMGTGFRVIAPSRFGYLGSPVPGDASPEAQADAHAALLDALGIDRAVVMGASAGARSALQMALRHPERVAALILVVPATYAPGRMPSVDDTFASRAVLRIVMAGADFLWWSAARLARPMLVRFLGVPPKLAAALPAADQQRLAVWIDGVLPLSKRLAGIRLDTVGALEPPPLQSVTAPTLIVTARDDLFTTLPAAEFAAERIPGATLVVFDSGGHLLLGRGDEAQAAVSDFLAKAGLAAGRAG